MSSKFITSVLSILILGVSFVFTYAKSNAEASLEGREMPTLSLPILEGGERTFQSIAENAALLITYASWCGTCKAEHPFLMELQAEGVPLYGIAWLDKPEKTSRFLKDLGNPFIWTFVDEDAKKTRSLGVTGTPETFVLIDGKIIYKHAGPIDRKIWDDVLKPMMSM